MNEIIYEAFSQRQIENFQEYQLSSKIAKEIDELIDSLDDNQKKLFDDIEFLHGELEFLASKELIDFVLKLFLK